MRFYYDIHYLFGRRRECLKEHVPVGYPCKIMVQVRYMLERRDPARDLRYDVEIFNSRLKILLSEATKERLSEDLFASVVLSREEEDGTFNNKEKWVRLVYPMFCTRQGGSLQRKIIDIAHDTWRSHKVAKADIRSMAEGNFSVINFCEGLDGMVIAGRYVYCETLDFKGQCLGLDHYSYLFPKMIKTGRTLENPSIELTDFALSSAFESSCCLEISETQNSADPTTELGLEPPMDVGDPKKLSYASKILFTLPIGTGSTVSVLPMEDMGKLPPEAIRLSNRNVSLADRYVNRKSLRYDFNRHTKQRYLNDTTWSEINKIVIKKIAFQYTNKDDEREGFDPCSLENVSRLVTEELNEYLCLLQTNDTVYYLMFDVCTKCPSVVGTSYGILKSTWRKYHMEIEEINNKTKERKWKKHSMIDMWHSDAGHNFRLQKVFDPNPGPEDMSVLNTYGGLYFTVKELREAYHTKKGKVYVRWMNDHIFNVLNNGNKDSYEYMMTGFAKKLRQPWIKIIAMYVMAGHEGAGKTILASMYGRAFGNYYTVITDFKKMMNFNYQLSEKLMLFLDEAYYVTKVSEGLLKTITTDETLIIDRKFQDSWKEVNRLFILMASDKEMFLPVRAAARRFAVFLCSPNHKAADPKKYDDYMNNLWSMKDDDYFGCRAWLGHFYDESIYPQARLEAWGMGQNIPPSCKKHLVKLRHHTADSTTQFWNEVLRRGYLLPDPRADWLYDEWLNVTTEQTKNVLKNKRERREEEEEFHSPYDSPQTAQRAKRSRFTTYQTLMKRYPVGRRHGIDYKYVDLYPHATSTNSSREYFSMWIGLLSKDQVYWTFLKMNEDPSHVLNRFKERITPAMFWQTTNKIFPSIAKTKTYRSLVNPDQVRSSSEFGDKLEYNIYAPVEKRFVELGDLEKLRQEFNITSGLRGDDSEEEESEVPVERNPMLNFFGLTAQLQTCNVQDPQVPSTPIEDVGREEYSMYVPTVEEQHGYV